MRTLMVFIVTVAIAIATSDAFYLKSQNGVSTTKQFVRNIEAAVHDLQRSAHLKKKAVLGAISAIGKAKLGVLRNLKEAKSQTLHKVIPNKAQNSLISYFTRPFSRVSNVAKKEGPKKDFIKIGNTEYVFVPAPQRSVTNEDAYKHYEEHSSSETSSQASGSSSSDSSAELVPHIPPAPTLPPLLPYNLQSSNFKKPTLH